ncbi:NUDIX hydrolase [Arsenicicoccus dermatophilus]|uniref:NUDIX hydrolase n=1 Tax=Arsenicicoccus dermatophilus TaxID=1076331 RepID=UPI00391741B6
MTDRLQTDAYGRVVRNGRVLDAPVHVDGYDRDGRRQVAEDLPHGVSPDDLLRSHGWDPVRPVAAERDLGDPHGIVLTYVLDRREDGPIPLPAPRVAVDEGIVLDPARPPLVRTRVAAYAVVHGPRGVLLTVNSERTNAQGTYGLPGGGIEPGEDPEAAVVREVWEETGQDIYRPRLVAVLSQHWIGMSPKGVLEDFQAVRLVYGAELQRAQDLVVHDAGGTTEAAEWVTPARLPAIPLAPAWAGVRDHLGTVPHRSV